MRYDPERHHRHTIRLVGYDYTQVGVYFLTLCTADRECLFGEIVEGSMVLSPSGNIVAEEWLRSSFVRSEIDLGDWVVMPNHLHGIVVITPDVGAHGGAPGDAPDHAPGDVHGGAHGRAPFGQVADVGVHDPRGIDSRAHSRAPLQRPARSLGSFVAGFKAAVTHRINALYGAPGTPIWQRNYYEHIVRDDDDLQRICQYIAENPQRWESDAENPASAGDQG